MRHASFFSGVGGLDLGFERAGIETVSVSEIDRYASAVLAERFPDAPNLGSITEVDANDIPEADVWSGGFPCQDLSIAGKRAGFSGKRSSLAFTFLDLVEQRRPQWLVLENVPGLFSSNKGADFGRLLYEMDKLGYGVSWRTLDARYFGVAQRRRRVFIVGSLESDRAAEVLLECTGCERHPSPRSAQEQETSSRSGGGADQDLYRSSNREFISGRNKNSERIVANCSSFDADRVRETNGVARRLDNKQILSFPSNFGSNAKVTQDFAQPLAHSAGAPAVFRRVAPGAYGPTDGIAGPNLATGGDIGGGSENIVTFSAHLTDASATTRVYNPSLLTQGDAAVCYDTVGGTVNDQDLLPLGLDTHRYRCCGNGVVAPVAEWIGSRIVEVDRRWREEGK